MMKKLKPLDGTLFTHATLKSLLDGYKNPNDKIKNMVKNKEILRIKQSLYAVGELYSDKSVSKELGANLIYGPSYISLEYALSFYGLIPERVYDITSVTTKMKKSYITPLGRFTYKKSPVCLYSKGIKLAADRNGQSFMIASMEKALVDKVVFTPNLQVTSVNDMISYVIEDLRINEEDLEKFDVGVIKECMGCGYKVKLLELLAKSIQKIEGVATIQDPFKSAEKAASRAEPPAEGNMR
jgi:hypothetical protein